MNRSLKLSMLVALALGSAHALALDLGQIQVKSALGQPLLAEIPLHPANPSELKNLTVQLASSEDFARAGVSGGRTAIPLHFSVVSNGRGEQVIRITSSVAVDDPYLDLLLEVNGSAGKSVREFTILLDPPGSTPAAAAQTRVARRSEPVTSRRSMVAPPAAAPAPAPARHAANPAAATAGNGQYGPVQSGQTLSAIARNTAPAGVDMHQMLLALKQANPDAFYHDNINALKSGVVLRVPTATEAQAMDVAAAVAEVQRQNSDWRAGSTGKPGVVADAGTRASASSSPTSKSSGTTDRLALVPSKEGGSNAGQGSAAKGDKSSSAVRQDLLRTQESLASMQQQTTDLKTRLKDLADINSKNERLLSLKDNEIAALQNELTNARKKAGLPAAPAAVESKPAVSTSSTTQAMTPAHTATVATASTGTVAKASSGNLVPAPALGSTSAIASTATASLAKPASVPAANAPMASTPHPATKPMTKPAARRMPPVLAEDPWYMQTWAWGVGAVVIILLILASMLGRRRKPVGPTGSASLADRFGSESLADGEPGSDVDQEELLDQLAEHPDDIGLHLELVTLYYSRRDVDHFEAAAEAMHAHITDPQQDEWQDVIHMGEDLAPGHPLFDHHPELPPNEENEARRAFDIDDYADHQATAQVPPPMPAAPKKLSEYNFNFDLTSAVHGSAAEDNAEDAAADRVDHADHVADLPAHDVAATSDEPASSWQFEEPEHALPSTDHALNEFSDDPVDTKLDLARAYLDMGDADGARAMLGEVIKEGSQMQQDVAKRLLETID